MKVKLYNSDTKEFIDYNIEYTYEEKKAVFNYLVDLLKDEALDIYDDIITHPNHYTWIDGIECKDVVKHFGFQPGSAIKYIWRHNHKGKPVEDLEKAIECLKNEIEFIKGNDNEG